jgi:hypothetical protein
MKKWIVGLTMLVMAVALPSIARAHKGHAHKVMGTITTIDGRNLMIKTTDGKTVMVMLDAKTKITRGNNKVELSAVKVGDRVVAEGAEEKEMLTASTVQLGSPATPKK